MAIKNRSGAGALAPGVDVRGDGGFVVAPPSQHANGKRYAWAEGGGPPALEKAPDWLVELLTAPPEKPHPAVLSGEHHRFKRGARHEALVKFAGDIRRATSAYVDFEAALIGFGSNRCDPPLPRTECERQSRDLFNRFAPEKPQPTGSLLVRCAADIEPERVPWLWLGRVARGKITLLAGHPGLGKVAIGSVDGGHRQPRPPLGRPLGV